jgi:hypothetical protein
MLEVILSPILMLPVEVEVDLQVINLVSVPVEMVPPEAVVQLMDLIAQLEAWQPIPEEMMAEQPMVKALVVLVQAAVVPLQGVEMETEMQTFSEQVREAMESCTIFQMRTFITEPEEEEPLLELLLMNPEWEEVLMELPMLEEEEIIPEEAYLLLRMVQAAAPEEPVEVMVSKV